MIIFHHNDGDGQCAGYWVKKLARHTDEYPITFFEINYGIDFPFDMIHRYEQVFIVDYSISTEEMDKLLLITPDVVWIDHHKTAIENYAHYDKQIRGLRRVGTAGCMLTHEYFTHTTFAPYFTRLIGAYDVWNFSPYGESVVKSFIKGLEIMDTSPESDLWDDLFSTDTVQQIIEQGDALSEYDDVVNEHRCKHKGFDFTLDGYKCFCLNQSRISSDTFKSVEGDYDAYIGFSYDGRIWSYSLRSAKPEVDVSELAAKYGGGGHAGSAGMTTDELILVKEKRHDTRNDSKL